MSWLSSQVHVLYLRLWFVWSFKSSFVFLKKEQPIFVRWWSGLSCWLSGEHPPIVSYLDSAFLSWVVYCGYNRPRGCLKSAWLTQAWPGFLNENSYAGHKKKEKNENNFFFLFWFLSFPPVRCLSFNLV